MHTKAVYRTAQALNEVGLVALRFNFRGVGSSTGSFDQGVGEQDDVRAALDWLETQYGGLPLVVGGFSFGSRVGLQVGAEDARVVVLVGLGLPVDRDESYDFGFLAESGKPVLVVQGESDEFGSGERIAGVVADLGSHVTLVRVPGADHYFTDRLDELRAAVREYFEAGAGAAALSATET